MPTRTWFPLTPRTVMVTSSPIITVSPTRLVRMSIFHFLFRYSFRFASASPSHFRGRFYIEVTRKRAERKILTLRCRAGLNVPAIGVAKHAPQRHPGRFRRGTHDQVYMAGDRHGQRAHSERAQRRAVDECRVANTD